MSTHPRSKYGRHIWRVKRRSPSWGDPCQLAAPFECQEMQTHRDRDRGLLMQLFELGHLIWQEWLLDKQRAFRLQQPHQLLGKLLVHAAMKIETDVQADGFDILDALNGRVQRMRRVEPPERFDGIHLDRGKALFLADLGLLEDVGRSIPADPTVDVASFAALRESFSLGA